MRGKSYRFFYDRWYGCDHYVGGYLYSHRLFFCWGGSLPVNDDLTVEEARS